MVLLIDSPWLALLRLQLLGSSKWKSLRLSKHFSAQRFRGAVHQPSPEKLSPWPALKRMSSTSEWEKGAKTHLEEVAQLIHKFVLINLHLGYLCDVNESQCSPVHRRYFQALAEPPFGPVNFPPASKIPLSADPKRCFWTNDVWLASQGGLHLHMLDNTWYDVLTIWLLPNQSIPKDEL